MTDVRFPYLIVLGIQGNLINGSVCTTREYSEVLDNGFVDVTAIIQPIEQCVCLRWIFLSANKLSVPTGQVC